MEEIRKNTDRSNNMLFAHLAQEWPLMLDVLFLLPKIPEHVPDRWVNCFNEYVVASGLEEHVIYIGPNEDTVEEGTNEPENASSSSNPKLPS